MRLDFATALHPLSLHVMVKFAHRFGLLVGLSAAGYVLSFCSQLVISYYFGTSSELDAYWAGLAMVNVLCFYLYPLRESLVPALHRARQVSLLQAGRLFSAGLSLLGLLVVVSSLFLWEFSSTFALWVGQTSDPRMANEIVHLVPWLIPYMGLFVLSETMAAVLLSLDRSVFQAVVRIVGSAVLLTMLVGFGARLGIPALVLAQVASMATLVVMYCVALRMLRLRLVSGFVQLLREGGVFPLFLSLLGSYLLSQLYVLGERAAMMHLSGGLVSAFQYSVSLVNVMLSIVAIPLANLLWPRFLANVEMQDVSLNIELAARAAGWLFMTLTVVCVFVWVHAEEIVFVLFSRGAFDAVSSERTVGALRATIFAAVPIGVMTIFGRLLMSQENGRSQIAIGIATTVVGLTVIGVAVLWESAVLVQWHWFAANTAGLIVSLVASVRRYSLSPAVLLRCGRWVMFVVGAVWCAVALTPSIEIGDSKLLYATALGIQGVIYLAIAAGIAWAFGVLRSLQAA